MGKKHRERDEKSAEEARREPIEAESGTPADPAEADPLAAAATETEALGEAPADGTTEESEETVRLREELGDMSDRYLRIAAEFDNFRKRVARERAADQERAKADLMRNILEGLDDLGRIAHLDLTAATVDDVASGVLMAERKLLDELASTGLERIAGDGEAFDPNLHEAVGSLPTEDGNQDGLVARVLQVGYRFGGVLLRPARVLVYVDRDDES